MINTTPTPEQEIARLREADAHFSEARQLLSEALKALAKGSSMSSDTPMVELMADNVIEQVGNARRALGLTRRQIEAVTGQPRISALNPA